MPGMHTNGPDDMTRDIRRAINEWIGMHVTPHIAAGYVQRMNAVPHRPSRERDE